MVQLPLYLLIYWLQLGYYILLTCKRLVFKQNIYLLESVALTFPSEFSPIVFIKIYFYTPRYVAYLIFSKLLKLKKKKISFIDILLFILVRIWVYFTGIPLFIFNIFKAWNDLIRYAWLYYDEDFGFCFINIFNHYFK